jgi:myo-inositol-1-phosphate synthase
MPPHTVNISNSSPATPGPINLAIVGLGNCASALLQGVAVAQSSRPLTGLTFPLIGGYAPSSLACVLAFDVDVRKVGFPISEAIFALPNCCWKLIKSPEEEALLPSSIVLCGPTLDGVAPHMLLEPEERSFRLSPSTPLTREEILLELKARNVDVLINYLPVGSHAASAFWAEICLDAHVALCNCIPVFIASDPTWESRFVDKGLPLIGDDMRSQFGASVLSQMLQELAIDRGHHVLAHIQQNSGGNTDFLNMCDKERLASKKISKEGVIRAQNIIRHVPLGSTFIHAGPSDFIPFFGDQKVATVHLELEGFGGAPVVFDARLSVQDSPNSAGVVVDAVRFLKVALELGISGSLRGASAFTQKTPPEQLTFSDAKAECEALAARTLTARTAQQVRTTRALTPSRKAVSSPSPALHSQNR